MGPNQNSLDWIARFCVHLLRQRRDMSPRVVMHRAISICAHAGALRPEDAANIEARNQSSVRLAPRVQFPSLR